jgi:hypothetical protein
LFSFRYELKLHAILFSEAFFPTDYGITPLDYFSRGHFLSGIEFPPDAISAPGMFKPTLSAWKVFSKENVILTVGQCHDSKIIFAEK